MSLVLHSLFKVETFLAVDFSDNEKTVPREYAVTEQFGEDRSGSGCIW